MIAGQLGMAAYGEKVVLAWERKEISVDPAILAEYVGTYKLAPNFDLVVTPEVAQLMAQATGQPKFPLFAESPAKFFLKAVDAQVEFFKENGKATYLVLHQSGQDRKAMKQQARYWINIAITETIQESTKPAARVDTCIYFALSETPRALVPLSGQ